MLKRTRGLNHWPTRHPTLREVSTRSGLSFSLFSMTSSSVIIGRIEFRFCLPCRKFYSLKSRGPRLFCIFTQKKVLGQKPTFSCRVGCHFLPVCNFVIREVRPAVPVPALVRPIVGNSLVPTHTNPFAR